LIGGAGADGVAGGAGKDILWGGDEFGGADGAADVFSFFARSDSGVGAANRDVIIDFNDTNGDKIDLSRFEGDPIGAGDPEFSFIGIDVIFGNNARELRALSIANGFVVEGDVNGDGKADFQIELRNPQIASLDGGNFIP